MAANANANPVNKDGEQELDKRNKDNETESNTDNDTDTELDITVYTGHGTPVTSGTSSPAAPTNPLNTAAGSLDLNMVNFFQQLLMQQNQMQQQNQTFMTQMFQSLSGSEGMNLPTNYGHKLPVSEWNQDMSFEAWKRKIFNFKAQSLMNENQKLILILESLKKNKERQELKD